MSESFHLLLFHGMNLKGQVIDILSLDHHIHPDERIMLAEINDIVVEQPDASLAGPSRHALRIVGAAMDANSLMAMGVESEEIIAV